MQKKWEHALQWPGPTGCHVGWAWPLFNPNFIRDYLAYGEPLGVTRGRDYHLENATMEIEPMFNGIAQILGVIQAIDSGVCDDG